VRYAYIANFQATRQAMWIHAGRIWMNNGYICTTTLHRVISIWSSMNGPMNGRFHPSPEKCRKEQQKESQSKGKHNLRKSKFPSDQEWERKADI
jgi:hypothetical protein